MKKYSVITRVNEFDFNFRISRSNWTGFEVFYARILANFLNNCNMEHKCVPMDIEPCLNAVTFHFKEHLGLQYTDDFIKNPLLRRFTENFFVKPNLGILENYKFEDPKIKKYYFESSISKKVKSNFMKAFNETIETDVEFDSIIVKYFDYRDAETDRDKGYEMVDITLIIETI